MNCPPIVVPLAFTTYFDCLSTKVLHSLNLANTSFFCLEHIHPNFGWEISTEGEKIPCASNGHHFHQSAYVGMHELQDSCGADSFIRQEGSPHLFAFNTSFTWKCMHVALYSFNVHFAHYALKNFHVIRVELPQPLVPKLLRMWYSIIMCQKIRFGPIHHIYVQLV